MKVFCTNVYVAEALLGEMVEQLLEATERASWRIYSSGYLLDGLQRVPGEKLRYSRRLTWLSRSRVVRRARLVEPGAFRHAVP